MSENASRLLKDGIYVLQSRWKVCKKHIVYYGIRKAPYTFENSVRVSRSTLRILSRLNGVRTLAEAGINSGIKRLIKQKIVVPKEEYKEYPDSFENARFCKKCVANDYVLPGIEFDDEGLCPMCANAEKLKDLKAVLPVVREIPRNEKGRYDVALFYTGGKDSTFLLYYLAEVLGLRVLALTWVTEYMSKSALKSIENAEKIFGNVVFVRKKPEKEIVAKIYRKHFSLAENTCICPSLAYVLFFDMLAEEKVPYLVLGNEPVQMHNVLFNNISPVIAFNPGWQEIGSFFFNLGRALTLKKPLTGGKMQMYFTVRTLIKGTFWGRDPEGKYQNEQVLNVYRSLKEAPELMIPFERSVKKNAAKGNIPSLVHVDFEKVADGYVWKDVKEMIVKKAGWVPPEAENKALHTSCTIEKCKEFTQLRRFREMKSRTVPYSAIELSLAVSAGNVSREKALDEMKNGSGFSGCEKEMILMKKPLSAD